MGRALATTNKPGDLTTPRNKEQTTKLEVMILGSVDVSYGIADPRMYINTILMQMQLRGYPPPLIEEAFGEWHASVEEPHLNKLSVFKLTKACDAIRERRWEKARRERELPAKQEEYETHRKEIEPLARLAAKKYNIREQHVYAAADELRFNGKRRQEEWMAALRAGEEWAIRATCFLAGGRANNRIFEYELFRPRPDPCAGMSTQTRIAFEEEQKEMRLRRGM